MTARKYFPELTLSISKKSSICFVQPNHIFNLSNEEAKRICNPFNLHLFGWKEMLPLSLVDCLLWIPLEKSCPKGLL